MKTAKDVLKAIKDNDVKYVDLRFTDPRGKWQHVTFDQSLVDDDAFADGLMFDGSSISGWRAINRVRHDAYARPGLGVHGPVLRRLDDGQSTATFSIPPAASRIPAIRAASPRKPRPISSRPASATPRSSGQRPNSSCSTTCGSRPTLTIPASTSIRSNCRPIRTPPTRAATSDIACAPRAAISRFRATGFGPGHARRNARGDGADGRGRRKAPPRSRVRSA